MSLGKMNTFIYIISTAPIKDAQGFVTKGDNILASVRAYKEDRRGNERWASMAAFNTATSLFRFRKIKGLAVDTSHVIVCDEGRFSITSVDNAKGRGLAVEVYAERQEGSVR